MNSYTSRKNNKRLTLARRRKQKRQSRKLNKRRSRRSRRSRRKQNKMSGGSNGIGQILTNSVRFTKTGVLNLYNKFKGNNLEPPSNPTLKQFH